MILTYTMLFTMLTVLLAPVLACLALADRWGMRQRLGMRPLVHGDEKRPLVWFHCASVGEATGMTAVIGRFMQRHPGFAVLVTTMTETGLAYVRQHVPQAHAYGLAPLDAPFIVRRVLGRVRPRALILLEGELWPSLLKAAAAHDCPVALVNGRMSDRSLARNLYVKPLFRGMLRMLTTVGVQHALDGERYITFGADPGRVRVTGNVKFDLAALAAEMEGPSREQLRHDLGLPGSATVIMAGCPRPVEEEQAVLSAFTQVRERYPEVKLIWAPRHLSRIPKVEEMLSGAGLAYAHRTRPGTQDPVHTDVIILDTMGELSAMYAAADMAFVGATMVPLGGHNVLEPAACGIPVLFGPHTENVRASASALLRTGGGIVVHDGAELGRAWLELLDNPRKRAQTGEAAARAVQWSAKAVDRTLDLIDRWILDPEHPGSRPFDGLVKSPFHARMLDPEEHSLFIRFVRCALTPLSLMLGILVRLRNGLYDSGLLVPDRLPVPVISVGGLTVGGAGKTPVVRYLALRLKEAGYRPAVLSRGYGRRTTATRRAEPNAAWQEVGDEPAFLATMLPDVPVVVGASRTSAGQLAIERYDANVLLLDDGFQHRRTGRQVDIVVHDASSRSNPGRLLPAGPFREPLSSLRRAHALVLTRTDQDRSTDLYAARLQAGFPHLSMIKTVYAPAGLRRLSDAKPLPLEWLVDREVLVLCGIANPASFAQTVTDAGGRVRQVLAYRDHYPFSSSDLDRAMSLSVETDTEWIVTTEKDAVRVPEHTARNHLVVLDISLRLTSGENGLGNLLSTLDAMD